jgi:AbrB family looped-hinge helix DNA binding protein
MELTKISSKGQIVIPLKIRNQLGMDEGSMIVIEKVNNVAVIKKVDDEFVEKIERSLKDIIHGRIKEWQG